jgi:acid phosphatase (class A)
MRTCDRCGATRLYSVVAFVVAIAACANFGQHAEAGSGPVPEIHPGIPAGYLTARAVPNGVAMLPAKPEPGSAALALDQEISRESLAMRGTPRWNLAIVDADLTFPAAAETFSCSLGVRITAQDTPHLYMLLRRSMVDAGASTRKAKEEYKRARPFVENGQPLCTPKDEQALRKNFSYPSGHAAIGSAWALILSEIAPEQADAILARGWAFTQSRVICNVHWDSDVIEGRFMGAATVAVLHSNLDFLADLQSAKAELAAARAKGLKPTRDCRLEAAELAQQPPPPP